MYKMLYDTHVHSRMSADSHTLPEEAIQKAEELGIGIIFTEHVDYDLKAEPLNFVTDVEVYLPAYEVYKNHRVLTGLEIGLTAESEERNRTLSKDLRLDYIIGSVHMVHGLDICTDFYEQGIGETETYIQYLLYVRDMVERNDFFDSLGHIDYPSRYSPFKNVIIDYTAYAQYYDPILKCLIEKNKCIEMNTVRLDNRSSAANLVQIYKRFYTLGGRTVTIGSDAHNQDSIGNNFSAALKICRETGLKPVYFSKRKMYVCV